jgi:DNA-directed RNA polymerase specialized sigma24 family protein
MGAEGSVSRLLGPLRAGDSAAVQQLWERYFRRLVGLARRRLQGAPRAAADEEDVALSAFDSFCRSAEAGRFPRLDDREDLWQLLVVMTARKAGHLVRRERRIKHGGGAVHHASALVEDEAAGLAEVVGREPTPEFAAEVAEECRRLLDRLGDAELRTVAVAKMEGYSNAEIAAQLGVVDRTVVRKVRVIRQLWQQKVNP